MAALLAAAILASGCGSGATSSAGPTSSSGPTAAAGTPAPTVRAAVPLPPAALTEIALPGGPNTIGITRDKVWVELHRQNSLASVDPTTSAVATYPDVHVHCYIAADGADGVWTTYHQGNLVTHVSAVSGTITQTVTIPEACGVGAAADQVWVASPSENKVYRLDPGTGAIQLSRAVDGTPFVVTPVGDLVYAAGEGGGGWFEAIDPADGHSVAKRHVTDVELVDMVALGFDALWVTGRTSTKLYRLDPQTLETRATIDIGSEPSGVAVGSDAVWVSQLGGHLTRVDPATNTATATWSTRYTFLAWPTLGFDRLWLTSLEEDVVVAIDLSKLTP